MPLPTAVETRTILQNRCLKSDSFHVIDPCQMLSPQHFPLAIPLSNSGLPGFILLCIPGVQVEYLKTNPKCGKLDHWDQGLALLLHFFGHCSLVMIPQVRGLKAKTWSELSGSDGKYR